MNTNYRYSSEVAAGPISNNIFWRGEKPLPEKLAVLDRSAYWWRKFDRQRRN